MAKKKVEEVTEKEEVKEVKEKKTRTKKEAEPKEEIKEEKVKRTRTKKVKEEPKEEIVEAEKIKDEEKTEVIEMKEEVTALAIFDNTEVEILKKMIAEYKARTNTNNANTTNSDTEKAKNFFENIDIPNEVRKIEYNTTLSIRGKQEIYDKIKEVAKKNGITASLLVNYLFYLILKPLGEWEKIK
jgi:uncharacterized protein PF11_0207